VFGWITDSPLVLLVGKVHGSLARAGKVRGQTPKVAKQASRPPRVARLSLGERHTDQSRIPWKHLVVC